MKKYKLIALILCLFFLVFAVQTVLAQQEQETVQEQLEQQEIEDQSQILTNYGFWFEDDVVRWQEFKPTLKNLTSIEIYVHKEGNPGNVIAEIKNLSGQVLGREIVSVPSSGWHKITYSSQITLTPGTKHRIYVYADKDSPSPDNRYFWDGHTDSPYNSECQTDVTSGWPTYDYAFKTFGKKGICFIQSVENVGSGIR